MAKERMRTREVTLYRAYRRMIQENNERSDRLGILRRWTYKERLYEYAGAPYLGEDRRHDVLLYKCRPRVGTKRSWVRMPQRCAEIMVLALFPEYDREVFFW